MSPRGTHCETAPDRRDPVGSLRLSGSGDQALRRIAHVPIRRVASTAIGSSSDEPVATATEWVDHCQHPPRWRLCSIAKPVQCLIRPDRKGVVEHGAIGVDPSIGFGAGKDHEPREDTSRPPAQPTSRIERGSFVPADLALEGAKVVQAGLDLDEQQRGAVGIVCEEIDPSVRPSMDDLHFASGQQAGATQSSIDVRGAAGVNEVSRLTRVMNDRRPDLPVDFEIESGGDLRYDVQCRVGSAHLHAGDVPPRDSDAVRQFSLGHPQAGAVVSTPHTKGRPQR